jgi:hypothetical protein
MLFNEQMWHFAAGHQAGTCHYMLARSKAFGSEVGSAKGEFQ